MTNTPRYKSVPTTPIKTPSITAKSSCRTHEEKFSLTRICCIVCQPFNHRYGSPRDSLARSSTNYRFRNSGSFLDRYTRTHLRLLALLRHHIRCKTPFLQGALLPH